MNVAYPYILEPQPEGGYVVQFADLEEAFTQGDTPEEAAFNAAEVLSLVIDQRLADEKPIPEPSSGALVAVVLGIPLSPGHHQFPNARQIH